MVLRLLSPTVPASEKVTSEHWKLHALYYALHLLFLTCQLCFVIDQRTLDFDYQFEQRLERVALPNNLQTVSYGNESNRRLEWLVSARVIVPVVLDKCKHGILIVGPPQSVRASSGRGYVPKQPADIQLRQRVQNSAWKRSVSARVIAPMVLVWIVY